MNILGIDIGGSGIKGALVDTDSGELLTERRRIPAPKNFKPKAVVQTVAELVAGFDHDEPIGVGFPAVVINGTVMTPATALAVKAWVGVDAGARISEACGRTAVVVNDADAAGLAEMKFGAGRGRGGAVLIFTLGTGIGSVLFYNGRLIPNFELGSLYMPNQSQTIEHQAAERVRVAEELSWKQWGRRLDAYFRHVERLFSPNLIIVGGGVSKKHEKFVKYINTRAVVVPAALRNEAGIVGAALAALPA